MAFRTNGSILRSAIVTIALSIACVVNAAWAGVPPPVPPDYVVGPSDVLMITSFDQSDLSGKFTVEADGTFTFPLVGRFKAGGLTLRQVEVGLKSRLQDGKYFRNPQISVSVEQYRSRKVFIVGEVRMPGTYPVSGAMDLIEALARAGSTLPTASGEAVIVHSRAGAAASGPTLPMQDDAAAVTRVDLRGLQDGEFAANNVDLRDGDTIFVPRAESIYVFGQVKNPGAYPIQQKDTTLLQALSLAGGMLDRGSTARIRVVRIVNGEKTEIKMKLSDTIKAGDTIIVPERFF